MYRFSTHTPAVHDCNKEIDDLYGAALIRANLPAARVSPDELQTSGQSLRFLSGAVISWEPLGTY